MPLIRSIPDTMDPATVARVDERLAAIRRSEGVAIPFAIESGSRAWGFPSPDSDYDCRFVFVRPIEQYLTPWPRRDVIETPLDRELDLNGWDLGKALKLLLKGNAVIVEWLTSPIAYGVDERFRGNFLELVRSVADRRLIGRHYLYLGTIQRTRHMVDEHEVALKKLFYVLRPAAALRWLRLHPEAAYAPMDFPSLMRECDPPPGLSAIVDDLLARKSVTRELGNAPLPPLIKRFVEDEFEAGRPEFAARRAAVDDGAARTQAESFFRHEVERMALLPAPD